MSVEDFDQDWKVDWANKVVLCETPSESKQYTVTDFWRWARKEEASFTSGMVYPHIIDTDGMGTSYGLPRKVKLANGYTIDPKSLKFLTGTDSTLLDQNNNVLIPDNLRKKLWWENSYVQGLLVALAIAGLLAAIL